MKSFYSLTFVLFTFVFQLVNAAELDAQIGWADIRDLGVPISGQINKVSTATGSYVKTGDSMLSIKCGIYNAQLKQAKAIASGLMPAVETALKEKELADELFDRTVLSEVEHRNAELVYIKTKSQYDASTAQVAQAKIRVGFCDLKADSPLIVLKEHIKKGEMYSLESNKPVLLTVASRNTMSATSKIVAPVKKVYRTGLKVKVSIAGKKYMGLIRAVNYMSDNSVEITTEFNFFDPRLIGNKTAKIIIQ